MTPRQAQVLGLVVDRYSNPEIARLLSISKRTVESHMAALLRSFAVADRAALIRAAKPDRPSTHPSTQAPPTSDQRGQLSAVRAAAAAMRMTAASERVEALRQVATVRQQVASARLRAAER
jgi:DNA-binding CsgD family transcriptional regulator